jgi:hypothetical protein
MQHSSKDRRSVGKKPSREWGTPLAVHADVFVERREDNLGNVHTISHRSLQEDENRANFAIDDDNWTRYEITMMHSPFFLRFALFGHRIMDLSFVMGSGARNLSDTLNPRHPAHVLIHPECDMKMEKLSMTSGSADFVNSNPCYSTRQTIVMVASSAGPLREVRPLGAEAEHLILDDDARDGHPTDLEAVCHLCSFRQGHSLDMENLCMTHDIYGTRSIPSFEAVAKRSFFARRYHLGIEILRPQSHLRLVQINTLG